MNRLQQRAVTAAANGFVVAIGIVACSLAREAGPNFGTFPTVRPNSSVAPAPSSSPRKTDLVAEVSALVPGAGWWCWGSTIRLRCWRAKEDCASARKQHIERPSVSETPKQGETGPCGQSDEAWCYALGAEGRAYDEIECLQPQNTCEIESGIVRKVFKKKSVSNCVRIP